MTRSSASTGTAGAHCGRESTCLACGKSTRVCLSCRHFARGRPNDRMEPLTERVPVKTRASFCEYFDPTDRPAAAGSATSPADASRQAAEDLFP
jgi:hypothetical protein